MNRPLARPGPRPVAEPPALTLLHGPTSGVVHLPGSIYASGTGPARGFDLNDQGERIELYEIVLSNGTTEQIAEHLDPDELRRLWPRLWLAPAVRAAWAGRIADR